MKVAGDWPVRDRELSGVAMRRGARIAVSNHLFGHLANSVAKVTERLIDLEMTGVMM